MPFDSNTHTIEECNYYCKRINTGVNIGCDSSSPTAAAKQLYECETTETQC
jgi:hypothetical protein